MLQKIIIEGLILKDRPKMDQQPGWKSSYLHWIYKWKLILKEILDIPEHQKWLKDS